VVVGAQGMVSYDRLVIQPNSVTPGERTTA
jgi:hypothetical protein